MWVAFAIVILYFVLKALGILKSPAIADITAIASASYFAGKFVSSVMNDISSLKKDVHLLDKDLSIVKNKVTNLNGRVKKVEKK